MPQPPTPMFKKEAGDKGFMEKVTLVFSTLMGIVPHKQVSAQSMEDGQALPTNQRMSAAAGRSDSWVPRRERPQV